ncbi:excinuclease ABC subunit A [Candidatus Uhrbacteria bacterium RIFCSPHIGHO2_02_FULL_57_19]|uniref:UvrABC system protein A n=1 Tax=Candidatus Uhrbacteria bacterium RIFCSPHIGHO2_02_FULL_57_19 TaxID=1802391 RepID=A0A1F7U8P3_9BACT|nr:MAG: excinuclease ABC subunit A [Candidatus Uhrbacteria bacterium RIFCSPHIGHO2_02_FULL_57_19]
MANVISIKGARVHNLKNVSLSIPKDKFVVITGLSGSGKSSLAFDTIYAEGQRRYMESLSSYARQFLELQDRPDVDEITGLSPTIAIDQKSVSQNPRSTVGTITEIYDYLRLLFARASRPHCHICGDPLRKQTIVEICDAIRVAAAKSDLNILSPLVRDARGEHRHLLGEIEKAGYAEVRVDGEMISSGEAADRRLDKAKKHSIEAVILHIPRGGAPDPSALKKFVEKGLELGNGMLILERAEAKKDALLSLDLYCGRCGISLPPIEPRLFSFNSPHGACPRCTGLGITQRLIPELVLPNPRLTIAQGAIRPWTRIAGGQNGQMELLRAVAAKHGFSLDTPIGELNKETIETVLYGTDEETYTVGNKTEPFSGVIPALEEKYRDTDSEYLRKEIESYMREEICTVCAGKRLRPESLAVLVAGKSIAEIVALPLDEALEFLDTLAGNGKGKGATGGKGRKGGNGHIHEPLSDDEQKIARQILKEVKERLGNLLAVGVDYLTLDRAASTLSGGEGQRVRLATQLGSQLSGVIYILDEPSIGLHARDNGKLIDTLKRLRDEGNTVIVVEHDAATIRQADYVIDVGPGAGELGGEIIATGTPDAIRRNPASTTGAYLSGKRAIEAPKAARKENNKAITIRGAKEFNLQEINVKIPLGKFVCVTGVSGSGKSTLILDILGRALAAHFYRAKELPGKHKSISGIEHLDKVISIDQTPIGRTPRSNPATYTGVFTAIRDLFTEIPEARMRGYDAGKFSFNVKGGGRCEACAGEGYVQISMQFLPDVYVECKECHGKRYNAEALEIHYKERTIADVLEMTVSEAKDFFSDVPAIFEKLGVLDEVGLGYIRLGQPANTLSGGEAQRVKLATELSRRATGRTLYILDEPTTGLHFDDIKRLLLVLQELVNKGNSVLVIEHNLDVIKSADWIIDMGPDGGVRGGKLVAEGTPQDLVKIKASVTGQYLKKIL